MKRAIHQVTKRFLVSVGILAGSFVMLLISLSCLLVQDSPAAQSGPSTAPTAAGGDLYAVIVGVSKYRDRAIPSLAVAAKDAQDFAAFLRTQKHLYKDLRITLLLNDQATKAEVERHLFYELRKAGVNDTIFLFFSGHGAVDPKRAGEFFFLTHEANPDFLEISSLNMSGLRFLKNLECPRVVLVADACHAGGFSKWRTKALAIHMKDFMADFSGSSGRVVITSSRPDEYSIEDPGMENSVFTHYFLEGLNGTADDDGDGIITLSEAYRYVYERTRMMTQGAQHPQLEGVIEGVFPLALAPTVGERPATSLELFIDPPAADVFVDEKLVGKTNSHGSLHIRFLPLGKPVPVKVRKDGWQEARLGPYIFSEEKPHVSVPALRLNPALTTWEVRTVPGSVAVKIDGKEVGKTTRGGRLTVHGLQVAFPHAVELRKEGYEDTYQVLTIPSDYHDKTFMREEIRLIKKAASTGSGTATSAPGETSPVSVGPPARSSDFGSQPDAPASERQPSPSGGRSSERSGL